MDDPISSALNIADNTVIDTAKKKNLTMYLDVSARIQNAQKNEQRLSLDMHWDTPLLPAFSNKWRLIFSDRLDSRFYARISEQPNNINTLREMYVSYQATQNTVMDMGRINTRYGFAFGYNPTDFLGKNTVHSVSSADPEALRTNRLGNVMLRVQHYWDNAAFTAILSPGFNDKPSQSGYDLDLGASNPKDRLLFVGSYNIGKDINPQLFYLQEAQESSQFGFNISRVLSQSTLMYAEWSGGNQALDWQGSLPKAQQNRQWRDHTAIGATWSSTDNVTFRIEGDYNGSGDNASASALSSLAKMSQGGDVSLSRHLQGMMTPKYSLLLQAYQKDIIDQYDINFIIQNDLQRHQDSEFAEIRHHIDSIDIALQWQKSHYLDFQQNSVETTPKQSWQLSFSYYF